LDAFYLDILWILLVFYLWIKLRNQKFSSNTKKISNISQKKFKPIFKIELKYFLIIEMIKKFILLNKNF